jgi:hypothetical protein
MESVGIKNQEALIRGVRRLDIPLWVTRKKRGEKHGDFKEKMYICRNFVED